MLGRGFGCGGGRRRDLGSAAATLAAAAGAERRPAPRSATHAAHRCRAAGATPAPAASRAGRRRRGRRHSRWLRRARRRQRSRSREPSRLPLNLSENSSSRLGARRAREGGADAPIIAGADGATGRARRATAAPLSAGQTLDASADAGPLRSLRRCSSAGICARTSAMTLAPQLRSDDALALRQHRHHLAPGIGDQAVPVGATAVLVRAALRRRERHSTGSRSRGRAAALPSGRGRSVR